MNNFQVRAYSQLDSTQLEAKRLIAAGDAITGLVVQARVQSAGHGRHQRVWQSPVGNLYATLILQKPKTPVECGHFSFIMALAVYDTVAQFLPVQKQIRLKWPNDVLVAGEKIAGILLEVEADWLLIGVGLNIASAPDGASKLGADIDVDVVLRALFDHFMAWQVRYSLGGFGFIRESWLPQAVGPGLQISCKLPNRTICGLFKGLDEQGALLLELPNGQLEPIYAGEVYFDAARS